MADPQAAVITQLRNIQAKTGRSIADLHLAVAASGLAKHSERRSWLMAQFKLGYGDANAVVHFMGQPLPALDPSVANSPVQAVVADVDPLDALYSGAKAHLRPLHEAVMALVEGLGPFEAAPKKTYISLRRKKQFAMVGPATQSLIEIGLNAKDLPAHPRLKPLPPGGMCQASMRIGNLAEADAMLLGWLRHAYDAAG
jgi:hypothetical protein